MILTIDEHPNCAYACLDTFRLFLLSCDYFFIFDERP